MIAAGNQIHESHEPLDARTTIDTRAIVDAFLSLSLPIQELAQHFDIAITQLLDILSTPESQQQLETARQLADLEYHLLHQRAKAAALEALTQIASDSNADTTERRRAATAILSPRATACPKGQAVPPPPAPNGPPTGEVPSTARRRGSFSSPNAQCPAPSASSPNASSPAFSSPHDLINQTLNALADKSRSPKLALAQIHPHFNPTATINGQPIPHDPQDFHKKLATDLAHCVQYLIEIQDETRDTAYHKVRLAGR